MPNFLYKVRDQSGRLRSAVAESEDIRALKKALREKGWYAVSVTTLSDRKKYAFLRSKRVKSEVIIMFTHQLSSMLDAGIPILHAMDMLWKQIEDPQLQLVVSQLRGRLGQGVSIQEAFNEFPEVFPPIYRSLLSASEVGANLVGVLRKLVEYLKKQREFTMKLKKATTYPVIVMVFAIVIVAAMLLFVVPTFQTVFIKIKVELPPLTKAILQAAALLRTWWFWVIAGGLGTGIALGYSKLVSFAEGRLFVDSFKFKVPVIGKIIYSSSLSRFLTALSLMVASGVSLARSLEVSGAVALNAKITKSVDFVRKRIVEGAGIGAAFSETGTFPSFVVEMVTVGESSGTLPEMLEKLSGHIEDDFDFQLDRVLTMLEPLLVMLVGGLVILVLLSIYLPIFKLWGGISKGGG